MLRQAYSTLSLYGRLFRRDEDDDAASEGDVDEIRSTTSEASLASGTEEYFSADEEAAPSPTPSPAPPVPSMTTAPDVRLREDAEIAEQSQLAVDPLLEARRLVAEGKVNGLVLRATIDDCQVTCRRNRAGVVHCADKDEFLARLHCVRQASEAMLARPEVQAWVRSSGRDLMSRVLAKVMVMAQCCLPTAVQGGEDPAPFQAAFDDMLDYLRRALPDARIRQQIEAELSGRRVACLSYFDVVIDFILLDAFDDLKVARRGARLSHSRMPGAPAGSAVRTAEHVDPQEHEAWCLLL